MPPPVVEWSLTADPADVVRRARAALAAGRAVVFPGDCGYVVLGLNRPGAAVYAGGPADAERLGLAVPQAARRLMLRAWPAPLAVDLPAAGGAARFRCPDHPLTDALLPALPGPVLVSDTFLPTAAAAADAVGDAAGLVVDAGELRTDRRPTVVAASESGWAVTEAGAFPADEVARLAARIVLFVCTGNTCRSPLAEGIAKALLAERLGCRPDDLPARGVWVLSAGVAAYPGGPATGLSVEAGAEFGADLTGHRSRPVNPYLLAAADDVVAMTRGHAEALAARYPGVGPPVRLLCGEADLDDPIGAGPEVYRACARAVREHLGRFLPEWARA